MEDDTYVEDKMTVGLLLFAGSHKVCIGNPLQLEDIESQ